MHLARIALAACVALASGCGGSRSGAAPTSPDVVAPAFPAARWVPASPSYVVAAPTFADAQRGLRDAIDGLGMFVGVTAEGAGSDLSRLLAINPFDENAVTSIGIDVQGGIVAFSEDLAPTFVVRMNAPELFTAFLDKQRERGMVSRSVIVDGIEIYTAEIIRGDLDVSWAIADGWLWIHFTPDFVTNEGTAWFTNSRKPQNKDWARDWSWAEAAAKGAKGLVGFVDVKEIVGRFVAKVPEALACSRLVDPIERVGLSIELASGGTANGRVSFDLGASAQQVANATLPVPEGFASVSANAPIAAQWNLDLVALDAWLAPCLASIHERSDSQRILDNFGVRAGRAVVQRVDIDDKSGAGVVSLDLVHERWFANQLDQIPGRSALERDRKFGPLAGHSISIPLVFSFDYVLSDQLAYVAMGDGVLAKTIGNGKSVSGPIAAVDLYPPMLSPETWKGLLELADLPESLADRLLRWREGHISIAIEGTSLVLAASGTRR